MRLRDEATGGGSRAGRHRVARRERLREGVGLDNEGRAFGRRQIQDDAFRIDDEALAAYLPETPRRPLHDGDAGAVRPITVDGHLLHLRQR